MKKSMVFFLIFILAGLVFATPRFTHLSNSVIKDNATGLHWQKCAAGQSGNNCEIGSAEEKTWAEAINYCKSLGGKWRLPEINELTTLIDYNKKEPAINTSFFPKTLCNTINEHYWSNTEDSPGSTSFAVFFKHGSIETFSQSSSTGGYVRCVSNP